MKAEEAGKRFREKAALPSEAFDTLTAAAKARAFRIAGVHKVRLVQKARDIVHRAIRDGTPFPEVRAQLLELYDTAKIPRPELHRLRFMFQQNAQQSYNDARRAALDTEEMTGAFPYRQYMTIGTGRAGVRNVRPTHAALHGLVTRWDDPFWDTHTPPWEYGCRCFFVPLTAAAVKRMRVKVRGIGYVRTRIRVPGQKRRGIKAHPDFVRGKIDLGSVDKELRGVLGEYAELEG
jgi:SPP1 gp7 family putative phage head morphogenesis protein